VLSVDEFTGRLMPAPLERRSAPGGRGERGVQIEAENQTLATITFQNLFRMYDKLAGMTGPRRTTEAEEFDKIYNLEVGGHSRPTGRWWRKDQRISSTVRSARSHAIVEEIKVLNEKGQPGARRYDLHREAGLVIRA